MCIPDGVMRMLQEGRRQRFKVVVVVRGVSSGHGAVVVSGHVYADIGQEEMSLGPGGDTSLLRPLVSQ